MGAASCTAFDMYKLCVDLPILAHRQKPKPKYVWDSATRKYIRKEGAGAASGADILSHSSGLLAASGASFLWRTVLPTRAPYE
eukprot:1189710-Pyramimonas_sp.AAC.1